MDRIYKYRGTVSQISFDSKGCGMVDLILSDISDWEKPPVRVTAYGGLAKYVHEIGMTDAEERYIASDWFYDCNLFLHRIEVPSSNEFVPAKIITQSDFLATELAIFGPQDYIETDSPEPMDQEQRIAWSEYRIKHM